MFYGANNDLEHLITTHLFVICPNNSGTTFLKNALSTSRHTWNLTHEGQNTHGFAGPVPRHMKIGKLWAAEQERLAMLIDPANYNWPEIRKAWYFQSFAHDNKATIFVENSPPFLLLVDQLAHEFANARFIFMVRDPYAVVEGIRRALAQERGMIIPDAGVLTAAASHLMTCFEYQRRNIERFAGQGIFFTYETLCDQPEQIERQIKQLVPELQDLRLRQKLKAKSYDEVLRNMNQQQLARLAPADLSTINETFVPRRDLLDFFGYSLRY